MCPGVDILTVLTQRIVSATVTPACNSTELAWLEEHQANITVGRRVHLPLLQFSFPGTDRYNRRESEWHE